MAEVVEPVHANLGRIELLEKLGLDKLHYKVPVVVVHKFVEKKLVVVGTVHIVGHIGRIA